MLRVYEEGKPVSAKTSAQHSSLCEISFDAKLGFPSKTSANDKKIANLRLTVTCSKSDGTPLAEKTFILTEKAETLTVDFPKTDYLLLGFTAESNTTSDAVLDNICFYAK